MTCQFQKITSAQCRCKYCISPMNINKGTRVEEVKKLKEAKKLVIRNLLMIEKRLLTPINKGGEKYAST